MTYIARNTIKTKNMYHTSRPATRAELLDDFIRKHDAISVEDMNKLGYGGNLQMALTYSSRRVGRMIVQITPRTWHILN